MTGEEHYVVPAIDWKRTSRQVMTLDWIDGIKLTDREALIAAGHDLNALAQTLVRSFLRQAIAEGFFHPTFIKAICSSRLKARLRPSILKSWVGSTVRRGSGSPKFCTG